MRNSTNTYKLNDYNGNKICGKHNRGEGHIHFCLFLLFSYFERKIASYFLEKRGLRHLTPTEIKIFVIKCSLLT